MTRVRPSSLAVRWTRAWRSSTRRRWPRSTASSELTPRPPSTATPSTPAATSPTMGERANGPTRRSGGASARRSPASRACAGCVGGAAEREGIAETFGSPALVASAAWAEGILLLAEGDHRGAVKRASHARKLWQEVDVPYEIARSRVLFYTSLGGLC